MAIITNTTMSWSSEWNESQKESATNLFTSSKSFSYTSSCLSSLDGDSIIFMGIIFLHLLYLFIFVPILFHKSVRRELSLNSRATFLLFNYYLYIYITFVRKVFNYLTSINLHQMTSQFAKVMTYRTIFTLHKLYL